MPKAPSSTALRRNQACQKCRKRKLKCDAARPHCGTCVKAWKGRIGVPAPIGYSHEQEPDCVYDPVERVSLNQITSDDPAERVRLLEAQIAELRGQLGRAHHDRSRSSTPNMAYRHLPDHSMSPSLSNTSGHPLMHQHQDGMSVPHAEMPPSVLPNISLDGVHSADINTPYDVGLNGISADQGVPVPNENPNPQFSQLLAHGWSRDLPDPASVHHLIDIFFLCDACGSRVIHKPSFLAAMSLPVSHPDHPHPAVLHAICATASRWVSRDVTIGPDGQRRDKFAEFHARKARSYIDQTMTSGSSIFPVLQACILLSWFFYMEGRWVEVWIFSGFQTRVSVPLRLNYPGAHAADGLATSSFLSPPKNICELECRRRAWWMAIMFDRIVSIGGWLHGIDVNDIGTELPLRTVDFDNAKLETASNPQHLLTPNVLTTHPLNYTDSFILLIKATMLFGRITDYNVRTTLRTAVGDTETNSAMFLELDRLVTTEFLESLPAGYRNCLGVGETPDGSNIDTDLYLVHLIPHAATITLHNAHIDLSDPQNHSAKRCLQAARSILTAYYLITSTSFDITRLHPTVVICWYLAAVVQVQFCKRLIQIGDRQSEANVWGEINLLRLAMLEYGASSPIGVRQEKLLQGVLTEILQLTSTQNPLSVRVLLYPFSHTRVFQNAIRDTQAEDITPGAHVAPLPSPAPFEEIQPTTAAA